jgi:hypothetical protein
MSEFFNQLARTSSHATHEATTPQAAALTEDMGDKWFNFRTFVILSPATS